MLGMNASIGTSSSADAPAETETELDQALSFPGLRTRLVDLKHKQAGGDLRPALGESVQARSEDDVLAGAVERLAHVNDLNSAIVLKIGLRKTEPLGAEAHVLMAEPRIPPVHSYRLGEERLT